MRFQLRLVAARLGDDVRAVTAEGTPALDLRAGVSAALDAAGAIGPADADVECTAAGERFYSWRARRDTGRQTAAIWWVEASAHTR